MTTEERRRRRFSENFRKEQVSLIENEKVTIGEVSRMYEVKRSSIRRWLKKYGKNPLPEPIIVQSKEDYNRLNELEKENSKLKELLGEQHVKLAYSLKLVEIAKQKLGSDFEKKI